MENAKPLIAKNTLSQPNRALLEKIIAKIAVGVAIVITSKIGD